jgi:hypothetical protein
MDKFKLACQLVERLAATLTVPGLTLDETTHACVLVFDGDLVVNVEYDDPSTRLVLSAYLDELPREGAEPLLRELMGANLYWHRTRGATLALEEGTNGIILSYRMSVTETDAHMFESAVQAFVNQAQRWGGRIAEFKRKVPASALSAAPPAPNMIFG